MERPSFTIDCAATTSLYERCPRCMYLHARGEASPCAAEAEEPALLVDAGMAAAQASGKWIELAVGPRFRVVRHRGEVLSAPVAFPLATVRYAGTFDALVERSDNRTVLVKYSLPSDAAANATRYQRELAALTHALEHPADPAATPVRVDAHAILGFSTHHGFIKGQLQKQFVPARWTELERRADRFLSFMRVATCILALPNEPPPAIDCPHCRKATPAGHQAVTSLAS